MKKVFRTLVGNRSLVMLFIAVVAILIGVGDINSYAAVTATASNDAGHSLNDDLTRQNIDENEAALLMKAIDSRITKIRPMNTPIDQIARHATPLKVASPIVKYYSVGSKDVDTTLSTAVTQPTTGNATTSHTRVQLAVANNDVFAKTSTIRVKGVKGYKADGVTQSTADLVLHVVDVASDGSPIVKAANGVKVTTSGGSALFCVPTIAQGKTLICMGRAAAELDVQTGKFTQIPTPEEQYCQKFMVQVGESTWSKISKKEVDWNFTDLEEDAVFNMKEGIEFSSWFGVKSIISDGDKNYYLTGGIWDMAAKEFAYGTSSSDKKITPANFIKFTKYIFTGGTGNKEKILFGGSDLIANLASMNLDKTSGMSTGYLIEEPKEEVLWGLKFKKLNTIFGTLYIMHHELFDIHGQSEDGFVLDYEYLTKATFEGWERSVIDQKALGVSDSKDVVLKETSCVYLRYPKAHCRVTPTTAS